MAEVNEIHEVEVPVEPRRGSFMLPFIMFLLGGVLIAAVVVAVLNVHSIIAWPAGQVTLGPNSSVADSGNAVTPPATTTATSVITPPETQNEPAVNAAPPQETTPPPATTGDTDNPSTSPPADASTPQE